MYVLDEESEPSKGRLLLLQLAGAHSDVRELKFLGETVVNGAAYQVRAMPDHRGRVAATVGNQLVVFTMQPDPAAAVGTGPRRAFEVECKHKTLLFAVYLAVHESTLIVGDLMQSVGIFKYDAEKRSLCKVASEYEGALPRHLCAHGRFLLCAWTEVRAVPCSALDDSCGGGRQHAGAGGG